MSNFYADNKDLQYYVEKGLDWEALVELTEFSKDEDAFAGGAEVQELLQELLSVVGEFIATEVDPYTDEIDREGVLFADGEASFPDRLQGVFDGFRELDLYGMCLPRELGGQNFPLMAYLMSLEIIARADVSVMTHYSFHGGMAMAMLAYSIREGSTRFDVTNRKLLSTRFAREIEEIREGLAWGCMDITEPDAGSDMAALRAFGEQDEEGRWFVTGQKIFITSGHGKYHFVIARTEEASKKDDPFAGLNGLSMFLVPAWSEDEEGRRVRHIQLDRIEEKMGHHGSATCSLTFDRAPAQLVGKRGEGFHYMLVLMNNARLGVGLESIGVCEAALRSSREYAEQRPSMGKTIDQHEMIADYLDEMESDIVGLRALALEGAFHEEMSQKLQIAMREELKGLRDNTRDWERRLRHHKAEARRLTPLLKYLAAEKAVEMSQRCIQIHGGVGYTREYGAEKLLRDSLVAPIYEGTSQIQSLMAMKDTLAFAMKAPQEFVKEMAQARWRSLSSRDPWERRLARLQLLSFQVQQHLIARTAADKVKGLQEKPLTSWPKAFFQDWNPKKDFAYAMLHAERLTRLLCDVAICELLFQQAKRHPERQEWFERYLERAEPRCRFLQDSIQTTGQRLLNKLADKNANAYTAAS